MSDEVKVSDPGNPVTVGDKEEEVNLYESQESSYVFVYNVEEGGELKIAIGILPVDQCQVMLGGTSIWVHHISLQGVDKFSVDGTNIKCEPTSLALVTAMNLLLEAREKGEIAKDPRPGAEKKDKGKPVLRLAPNGGK
jgi:hypothetical protein